MASSGAAGPRTPLSEGLAGAKSSGQVKAAGLCVLYKREPVFLLPGSRKTAGKGLCVNTDSEVSRWGLLIRGRIS